MSQFKGLNPGELHDRLSILLLKVNFQDNGNIFINELNQVLHEINRKKYHILMKHKIRLMLANLNIWELESDIRLGKEKLLSLKEIGRQAIKIREYNNIRWSIKNKINKKYNFPIEKKHAWSKKLPKSILKQISKEIKNKHNIKSSTIQIVVDSFTNQLLGVKK
jgi:hypothetical protein